MRTILMLVVFVFFTTCQASAEDIKNSFRKTKWGMSVSDVKKSETGNPKYDKNDGARHTLGYSDTISGLDCKVIYLFVHDKLVRAKYVISENHSNKTDYLSDFDKLQLALTGKYGKPVSDDTYWKNDLYKDQPQEWGMALAVGHLARFSKWQLTDTTIFEYIKGDNYDIELGIEYAGDSFKSLEEKLNDEESQDKI